MIVEASRIPPIHQRKLEMGLRVGCLRPGGMRMAGSMIRFLGLQNSTRLALALCPNRN
jgi:hypothetical protein